MRCWVVIGLLALAACGRQHSPQDQAVRDAHDVALVKRANQSAIKPIEPQLILYPDIEANQLQGAGCAFGAEDNLGTVLLTRTDRGYMKLADKIVQFPADMGSAELLGARSKYRGTEFTLQLAIDAPDGSKPGAAQATYPGRLTVRDLDGNVVYDRSGSVQCGI